MKEEIVKGLRVRTHIASNTMVSEDGTYVARTWKNNGQIEKYEPKIYTDNASGRKYVENKMKERTYIDEMVITCFCPPKPNGGVNYVVSHKDGQMSNNYYKNLAWVPGYSTQLTTVQPTPVTVPKTNNSDKVKRYIHPTSYEVHKDGSVWQDKKQLIPLFMRSESGQMMPTIPLVAIHVWNRWGKDCGEELHSVDDIMADAGFVAGNKESLLDPVILHLDNDYTNCASDNLLWVEASNPRYSVYKRQMAVDMEKLMPTC